MYKPRNKFWDLTNQAQSELQNPRPNSIQGPFTRPRIYPPSGPPPDPPQNQPSGPPPDPPPNSPFTAEFNDLNGVILSIRTKIDSFKDDRNNFRIEIMKKIEIIKNLIDAIKLKGLKNNQEELDRLKQQVLELTADNARINGELQQITQERKTLENKVSELEARNRELEQQNRLLGAENGNLQSLLDERIKDLENLQNENNRLNQEINRIKTELDECNRQIKTITEEKQQIEIQLEQCNDKLAQKDTEINNLQTQIAPLQQQITDLNNQIAAGKEHIRRVTDYLRNFFSEIERLDFKEPGILKEVQDIITKLTDFNNQLDVNGSGFNPTQGFTPRLVSTKMEQRPVKNPTGVISDPKEIQERQNRTEYKDILLSVLKSNNNLFKINPANFSTQNEAIRNQYLGVLQQFKYYGYQGYIYDLFSSDTNSLQFITDYTKWYNFWFPSMTAKEDSKFNSNTNFTIPTSRGGRPKNHKKPLIKRKTQKKKKKQYKYKYMKGGWVYKGDARLDSESTIISESGSKTRSKSGSKSSSKSKSGSKTKSGNKRKSVRKIKNKGFITRKRNRNRK